MHCFYLVMDVCLLEQRITELEYIILGNSSSHLPVSKQSILDQLFDVHKNVAIAERKNKIKETLDRTNEIQKYMDPHFLDDIAISNEAKIKLILAQESEILKTAQALESLQTLKTVLNHPAYADLSTLKSKFAGLLQKHVDQQTTSQDLLEESNALLQTYTETTRDLSKLLVAWHKKVPSVAK